MVRDRAVGSPDILLVCDGTAVVLTVCGEAPGVENESVLQGIWSLSLRIVNMLLSCRLLVWFWGRAGEVQVG